MLRTTIAPLFLFGLGLIACSSNGDDDDDSTRFKDAATSDSGDNNNPQDGGMPDSGDMPDTGVQGACNPVDGTGCLGADEYCVYVVAQNVAQCRTLPAMNMLETACNVGLQDCAAGLTCAQLQGEAGPTCKQVCDPQSATACDGVTGMSNDYVCITLDVGGQTSAYGLCQGVDTCDPVERAAACPANETCSLISQTETVCAPAGAAMVGEACTQMNCAPGAICIDVGGGGECYEPCDQMTACTSGTDRCQALQGLPWGICLAAGMTCDPINMPCMAGMTCSIVMGAPECATSGTAMVGQACNPNMQCVDNAVCAFLQGEATPLCYEPCDPMNPQCSMGQCGNIGQPFGICVVP